MNQISLAKPLLVVLPYHNGDFELAKQLLQWITELGDCKPHSILLAADSAVPRESVIELNNIARPLFHFYRTMIVQPEAAQQGKRVWAPNVMFMQVARQIIANYKLPFLWMEPDCIPLKSDWLDRISEEYEFCPRRFMGPIIHQENNATLPADHLTGCSVYPNDAYEVLRNVETIKTHQLAWDIGGAGVVIPKAANTDLIHHFWGSETMPPIFVERRAPDSPKNHVTLDFIRHGAVMFHRSKDGNLIKLLRNRRDGIAATKENTESEPTTDSELAPVQFQMAPEIGDDKQPSAPAKTSL